MQFKASIGDCFFDWLSKIGYLGENFWADLWLQAGKKDLKLGIEGPYAYPPYVEF